MIENNHHEFSNFINIEKINNIFLNTDKVRYK